MPIFERRGHIHFSWTSSEVTTDFRASFNAFSWEGKLFQALGLVHENERCPDLRRVRSRSYGRLLVERRQGRELTSADVVTQRRRYSKMALVLCASADVT